MLYFPFSETAPIYQEIAGEANAESESGADSSLLALGRAQLARHGAGVTASMYGKRLDAAAGKRDWSAYAATLGELMAEEATQAVSMRAAPAPPPAPAPAPAMRSPLVEDQQARLVRDLLARTLILAVGGLLNSAPELAAEAEALGRSVSQADTEPLIDALGVRLKQLCFRIEMRSGDIAEQQELLVRLFMLLLDNVSELIEEGTWLHGQIESVKKLIDGPINHHALLDATRALKDVIYKQGTLKHSLTDAKSTVKTMMITFIDRLGELATSTGEYHEKLDLYSRQISQATDIAGLTNVLEGVMRDTRESQSVTLHSRDELLSVRHNVEEADQRIQALEEQLQQMSELVREDQLTGSLNRRGLDDVFERELARADRRKSPLCVAMLDLDDFKRLNDTHGHVAGDEALIHLVRVIKNTLRSMDVIGRFGGEEFLILLPDTTMDAAVETVTRLQRELTKRIFMHNNERLLITFSAGVAMRKEEEDPNTLIKRADAALYRAKKAGKNRVVGAD